MSHRPKKKTNKQTENNSNIGAFISLHRRNIWYQLTVQIVPNLQGFNWQFLTLWWYKNDRIQERPYFEFWTLIFSEGISGWSILVILGSGSSQSASNCEGEQPRTLTNILYPHGQPFCFFLSVQHSINYIR